MRPRRWGAALGLALTAFLWGLAYRLEPQKEELLVEPVSLTEKEAGELVLAPGKPAPGGVAYVNRGRSGCRVRVKICAPEMEGEPVLQAGDLVDGQFQEAGSGREGEECWVRREGYLYYQNPRTDDLLLPGRRTPAAYTAVRLREDLSEQQLEALRELGAELYLVAQAKGENDSQWR